MSLPEKLFSTSQPDLLPTEDTSTSPVSWESTPEKRNCRTRPRSRCRRCPRRRCRPFEVGCTRSRSPRHTWRRVRHTVHRHTRCWSPRAGRRSPRESQSCTGQQHCHLPTHFESLEYWSTSFGGFSTWVCTWFCREREAKQRWKNLRELLPSLLPRGDRRSCRSRRALFVESFLRSETASEPNGDVDVDKWKKCERRKENLCEQVDVVEQSWKSLTRLVLTF